MEDQISARFVASQNEQRRGAVQDAAGMLGREARRAVRGRDDARLAPYVAHLRQCLAEHFAHAGEPGWRDFPLDATQRLLASVSRPLSEALEQALEEASDMLPDTLGCRHFPSSRRYAFADRVRAAEAFGDRLSELMDAREAAFMAMAAGLTERRRGGRASPPPDVQRACREVAGFLRNPAPAEMALLLEALLECEAAAPRDISDRSADASIEAVFSDLRSMGCGAARLAGLRDRIRLARLAAADSFSLGLARTG